MSGMICIKLYGDINFDSEEERILKFLEKQGYQFDFLSSGDDE
jgi:hypothetical protein